MAKKSNEPSKITVSEVKVEVKDIAPADATGSAETSKVAATDEIPTLPADFPSPPNPLNDFASASGSYPFNTDPTARFIQDGKFTPYRAFLSSNSTDLLMDKANDLARTIWSDATAYVKANETLNSIHTNQDYLKEGFTANRKFYEQGYVSTIISQALGLGSANGLGASYLYMDKVDDIVRKLKRLERKNSNEEIFDDNAREQIINYILLPTTTVTGGYDRCASLNLAYPDQKIVVNEILTKDEVNSITNILNYLPRSRKLLANCFEPKHRINKEDLTVKLAYPSRENSDNNYPHFPVMAAAYSDTGTHSSKLEAILSIHRFLSSAIPYDIIRDLAPGLGQSGSNMSVHSTNMHTASKAMREASLNYIREERGLGELLQKISEYASAVTAYFNYVNNEIRQLFDLLNRLDISYETLLNNSDDYIQNSIPW